MDSALPPKNYNAPGTQNIELGRVLLPEVTKDTTWDFLRSTRFWIMLLGVVGVYLETKGFSWWGEAERNLVASIATIFITIKTVDRTVDKLSQ